MKMRILILLFTTSSILAFPPGKLILQNIDDNYKLTGDIKARVTITQQKSGQGTRTVETSFSRRDRDDAFLITITGPESDKGNGYLRIGDNLWIYRRNTRTFQHISRSESIAGTDARGDDFEYRKISEQYQILLDSSGTEKVGLDTLGTIPVYRIELLAKVNDVDFPRKTLWVRTDNFLILKDRSYSRSGTPLQTAFYLKYVKTSGSSIPVKQMYIDEFEKGNKSIVEISEIDTRVLDDFIFTKAYLENLNR